MITYKDILKATTLFGGVHGLSILLNIVRTKLVALLLGPSGIGLNSIYNEMRELIHTSTNMGMDVSSIREISAAFELGDKAAVERAISLTRSWVMLLSLLGGLVCFVLCQPLSLLTFHDTDHTWGYALLSPTIIFSTLTCGEMAILKGVRRIKALATISILNVVAGIVTTIPVYYFMGMEGVVPALVLLTSVMFAIVACYSYRVHPLHVSFKTDDLRPGLSMLMIGVSFVLTGFVSHGTELAIRTYLQDAASLHITGLYQAGFTIVMTYGGVAFASIENDYYPRLSGVFSDIMMRRQTVQRQMEVLLMIMVPLVIVMIPLLPIAVPLLLSNKFVEVIPMTQVASLGLIFRAVYLSVAYMPLAAGDSKSFFCLETVSYAIIFAAVVVGYQYYGLMGTGIALVVSNFMDMVITLCFVRWRYKTGLTPRIALIIFGATIAIVGMLALCL